MSLLEKIFTPETCKVCRVQYQPVTWISCRVDGYCSNACRDMDKGRAVAVAIAPGVKPEQMGIV